MVNGVDENNSTVAKRAEEIFAQRFDANVKRVDRMFIVLMLVQWVFAIVIAIWASPYAWAGKVRTVHLHVYIAVVLGGVLSSLPIALALLYPGAKITRYVIAVAQMLWSAVLIHLLGGRIETHFHVFGSLAFLAFYRDWRVMVPATIVVAADHLIRQMFWPESVYGVLNPASWRFLEHAGWVVFEDIFLVIACLAGVKEMRLAAGQQARIETTERLEREMEIASRIQTSILPRTLVVEGLEIAAVMAPATEVGGDYYDVLPVDGGCWFGIGDVAGHGLTSGLVMLQTQSAVSALVGQNPSATPRDVLVGVNKVLYDNIRHRLRIDEHMTISLVRYHSDGRCVFAGAHEDIVIWRAATKTCETIPTSGTWLGMGLDIGKVTVDTSCQLLPDDVLLLYTDGVTEAMNGNGEQFGMDRLREALGSVATQPVKSICDHLMAKVREWSSVQVDDITLLVSRYDGPHRQVP